MCERRIELRPERQWVQQLADAAYRLGLATCFLRAVDDLQGPGQAVMNAPVLGKIGYRGLQRGDRLIGTVVVLEGPTAPQSTETTVTLFEGPVPEAAEPVPVPPRRPRRSGRLAGVDMLGMAGEQVPELDEP